MMPSMAKPRPASNPNMPPRRMLYPAYSAIAPMIKSRMPQMNRIGMNNSTSRLLRTQVLSANSEIASRMWKPPSTNIITAAYVSQPGRPVVVGVLSLLCCSTSSSYLSRLLWLMDVRLGRHERRRRHRLHRSRLLLSASTPLASAPGQHLEGKHQRRAHPRYPTSAGRKELG